jgi:hypothetical protein
MTYTNDPSRDGSLAGRPFHFGLRSEYKATPYHTTSSLRWVITKGETEIFNGRGNDIATILASLPLKVEVG